VIDDDMSNIVVKFQTDSTKTKIMVNLQSSQNELSFLHRAARGARSAPRARAPAYENNFVS